MSRCPICRCEIESHCPRYNQSNFDKLKGPLQPITVTNHEDPSRLVPPAGAGASIGLAGSHPPGSSHVRMTFRVPYPTPQLFDRMETAGARAEAAARPVGTEPTSRPPTRYVRPSLPRHTPPSSHQASAGASAFAARARNPAGNGTEDVEDAPAPKRRRRGEADAARPSQEAPAAPLPSTVHEWRVTFEDAPAAPPHSQARGRRVTFADPPSAAPAAPPRARRGSKRERGAGADGLEAHRDDSPIAARTRTQGRRQE